MKISTREDTLTLAREAIKYVRGVIHASSTTPILTASEFQKLNNQIHAMRNRLFSKQESLIDLFFIPGNNAYRYVKRDVRSVKNYHIGNCAEYANLVLNYMRKKNVDIAEYFSITDGDHAFVVINRMPGSDENKPETWGENAVIIDAWSNDCYGVSDIYKKMHCYVQNFLPDKPNTVHPFTTDNLLNSDYAIYNGNNDQYKKSILKEMHDKLDIITSTLIQAGSDEQIKNEINTLYQQSFQIDTDKMTNFDVERQCNKFIKKALKLVEHFPVHQANCIRIELIKAVISYVKYHSPVVKANEFIDEIEFPKYDNGFHDEDILEIAKSLKYRKTCPD